jgi:hypothetical protein
MDNLLRKIPDPIVRLAVVFGLFIGLVLVARAFIPSSLKEVGSQRTSAIERELAKEISYIGSSACAECHDDLYDLKKEGYHRNLSCEGCHGAAVAHTEDPDEYQPPAPRERKFCPTCHMYNLSRPSGFPQINPVAHNPLQPCIACHDPHDPVPPETPAECTACHAQVARMKAVSPHVLLECSVCHATPKPHKLQPRRVRSAKPTRREFCAQCHGSNSDVVGTPKIDLLTHGEKYLCWQCHYPHMPEVK